MTKSWRDRLITAQTSINDEGELLHFGELPNQAQTHISFCDHLAVLRVSGEEARQFLQSQLSADLNDQPHLSRLAMHLNLKGRAETSMRLVPDPLDNSGDYLLALDKSLLDSTLAGLKKYLLFSKTTIEPATYQLIGVSGPEATTLLEQAGLLSTTDGASPPPANTVHLHEQTRIVRAGLSERYLLISPTQQAESLWQSLLEQQIPATAGGSLHWRYSDILSGEGHLSAATRNLFLPQAMNYDLLGGVSFKKGCYLGQEVVARIHFKGKSKQRMQHLSWQKDIDAKPGQTLRDNEGKSVGEIVQFVPSEENSQALVALRADYRDTIFLDEQPLDYTIEALPYPLP